MRTITSGAHQTLRLPNDAARVLKLRRGAKVAVFVSRDGVFLVPPRRIPRDQRYFWTEEWQAKEREADEDLAAGRVRGPFSTADEATAALRGKHPV